MKVVILTESFPYGGGEQFLETEIQYYQILDVNIMPIYSFGHKRILPKNVKVDDYLSSLSKISRKIKFFFIFKALCSKYFYSELKDSIRNIKELKYFLGSMIKYYHYHSILKKFLLNEKDLTGTIFYTYWNTEVTYALQSLKQEFNFRLVSRIHGFDLYQERRFNNYMPLKKQFTKNIDKVFTITESANNYLSSTYGFDSNKLELSRLGVNDNNIVTKISKMKCLHIVSCSSLTYVKRIDKLIQAIHHIAKENPDIYYKWTHIGGGELHDNLLQYSSDLLKNIQNIDCEYLGHVSNDSVYEFYKHNKVDVFINTSFSEGVPVSIMEAMSCHIPIIAPNVGGISDMLIDSCSGLLLSAECTINEIVSALNNIEFFKDEQVRETSYNIYREKYNAEINYTNFVKKIISISKGL